MQDKNAQFDDFDLYISPEELQDDNPIDEDFEPDFDMALEYSDEDYPEDDFDLYISPEELQDDNPIDEDFEPDFDMALEY